MRDWHENHIASGYHEQEWESATPDHELVGAYHCTLNGQPATVKVSFLEIGPSGGPEYELDWENFHKVTVLDEKTALAYLIQCGAVTLASTT